MTWSKLSNYWAGFLWDAVRTRGVRLAVYLILTAALFPSSRFILLLVLLAALAVTWTKEYHRYRSPRIFYLAAAVLALVIGYGLVFVNVQSVDEQRFSKSPWSSGILQVRDGFYTGEGEGFRGPIIVGVEVRNHRIIALKTMEYPDLVSVLYNQVALFKRQILKDGKLERPGEPLMLRGAPETLTGYANAVASALEKGIPDYPNYSVLSRAFLGLFIGRAPDRVTLNALAILFAAFMVFEYTLQSMLVPGTGRTISCYNCATCVGACPIKEVEGVQMPMGLVLLTRLGEYERVMELSKYCVGCGRCVAKCPIGNSGPLIIAAAFEEARRQKKKKLNEQEGPA